MCPPAHLWFFSAATLPRLVGACGFEVVEVATLRGDGNNLYQYALMAAGNWLNDLRLRLRPAPRAQSQPAESKRAADATKQGRSAPEPVPRKAPEPHEPSRLLQKWLDVLDRAQPITNAMARGTRWLIEPLERRGWGDELLVYARRKADAQTAARPQGSRP
jgi:hypothetical protein